VSITHAESIAARLLYRGFGAHPLVRKPCRAPIGIGDLGAISVLLDSNLRSQQRAMPSHRALIPWPLARAERRVRAQSAARRGHGARYSPAHLPVLRE